MLNEKVFESERFVTEAASTVTVSPELLQTAANEGRNAGVEKQRRGRRSSLFTPSAIGGWKVRMW